MPKEPKESAPPGPPAPAYVQHRIDLFTKFQKEFAEVTAAMPRSEITVKFPQYSKECKGTSLEMNPFQAAKAAGVEKKLITTAMCAIVRDLKGEPMGLVNGQWDMERPLESDCSIELKFFEDEVRRWLSPSLSNSHPVFAQRTSPRMLTVHARRRAATRSGTAVRTSWATQWNLCTGAG
jgi:hypothetical protein